MTTPVCRTAVPQAKSQPGSAFRPPQAIRQNIEAIALRRGFLFADLEALFHGHGIAAAEPWFVLDIEPNRGGTTAIADAWFKLLQTRKQ